MLEQMQIVLGMKKESEAWMDAKVLRLYNNIHPTVKPEVMEEHLENLA